MSLPRPTQVEVIAEPVSVAGALWVSHICVYMGVIYVHFLSILISYYSLKNRIYIIKFIFSLLSEFSLKIALIYICK